MIQTVSFPAGMLTSGYSGYIIVVLQFLAMKPETPLHFFAIVGVPFDDTFIEGVLWSGLIPIARRLF